MLFLDAFALAIYTTHLATDKQECLVDIHKLLTPKLVLVQDIGGEDFRGHTAGQVFDTFAYETAVDCGVVTMCFRESLLQ